MRRSLCAVVQLWVLLDNNSGVVAAAEGADDGDPTSTYVYGSDNDDLSDIKPSPPPAPGGPLFDHDDCVDWCHWNWARNCPQQQCRRCPTCINLFLPRAPPHPPPAPHLPAADLLPEVCFSSVKNGVDAQDPGNGHLWCHQITDRGRCEGSFVTVRLVDIVEQIPCRPDPTLLMPCTWNDECVIRPQILVFLTTLTEAVGDFKRPSTPPPLPIGPPSRPPPARRPAPCPPPPQPPHPPPPPPLPSPPPPPPPLGRIVNGHRPAGGGHGLKFSCGVAGRLDASAFIPPYTCSQAAHTSGDCRRFFVSTGFGTGQLCEWRLGCVAGMVVDCAVPPPPAPPPLPRPPPPDIAGLVQVVLHGNASRVELLTGVGLVAEKGAEQIAKRTGLQTWQVEVLLPPAVVLWILLLCAAATVLCCLSNHRHLREQAMKRAISMREKRRAKSRSRRSEKEAVSRQTRRLLGPSAVDEEHSRPVV